MQYCVSTVTMFARTLLSVTLYVHCLSCYNTRVPVLPFSKSFPRCFSEMSFYAQSEAVFIPSSAVLLLSLLNGMPSVNNFNNTQSRNVYECIQYKDTHRLRIYYKRSKCLAIS